MSRETDINISWTETGMEILTMVGCDHGHVAVVDNMVDAYLVVELQTEGTELTDECLRMHVNANGRFVDSFPYTQHRFSRYANSIEAYRAACQRAMNVALEHTSVRIPD